ncbi:MAG: GMP synthase (glutamine-hydrolyzing) [Motiliproteus sp.]|jgi:GMP synthase (glutamine-hydrolysing)
MKQVVYISMLGEPSHYNIDSFKSLCDSGLEKDWVVEWFQSLAIEYGFSFISVDICNGGELPSVSSIDTVIVGGSNHDIRDAYPWLERLTCWLTEYRTLGRPLLAICASHQLVSTIFEDGTLTEREGGLMAGSFAVKLSELGQKHPLFEGISKDPKFLFANYLHVLPSNSLANKALASIGESSAICVDHGGYWYSCQFHPESHKKTWECFFNENSDVDMDLYCGEHSGRQLIENFFKISKNAVVEQRAKPMAVHPVVSSTSSDSQP